MNTVIRLGTPADARALAELAERTFRETFEGSTSAENMAAHLAHTYGESRQRAELKDPDMTTLLVDVDGTLAGFAMVRPGETPACVTGEAPIELWRFYIDRAWHGKGLAQSLMYRVVDECVRRGARTLWLGVWEHNHRAQAFYAKFGFSDAGSHVYLVGSDAQTDRVYVRAL